MIKEQKTIPAMLLLASLLFASISSPTIFKEVQAVSESNVIAQAIRDAYIDEGAPTTNFNVSTLLVRSAGYPTQNARSYLGFDLSVIPPAAIVSAYLKVYLTKPPSVPRMYDAYVVHGSWNESGITWNNQPWWGFRCSTAKINTTQGWVSFDVTAAIRGYVNKWYAVEGFMIRDANEYDSKGPIKAEFASKEDGNETLRPILVVTVSFDPDFQIAAWPDYQTTYVSGSVDFWSDVRSVNLFNGDILMNVTDLDPTMSAEIQPKTFYLSEGYVQGVRITIRTSTNTPATKYTITITAKSGEIEHKVTVTLEVKAALILRDLPLSASNDTDITVTLTYNEGIIATTGLIIEEWLPTFVNYTSHQLPQGFIAAFSMRTYDDGRTQLKWVLANSSVFSGFTLNYTAHFAVPQGKWMPGNLWFWGSYRAMDTFGMEHWDNILGDSQIEISIGLPGSWDDDSKVNDWELMQVINLWTKGGLTDSQLLIYIDLWSQTWWL